jgi:hypothetical protein
MPIYKEGNNQLVQPMRRESRKWQPDILKKFEECRFCVHAKTLAANLNCGKKRWGSSTNLGS